MGKVQGVFRQIVFTNFVVMPIVSVEQFGELVPQLSSPGGQRLTRMLFRLLNINKVNAAYDRYSGFTGPDFACEFLKGIGVDYQVGNADRLNNLPEGAFITVSNHPYGHIDGISLIDLFGHLRPGYKVMVNKLLSYVEALRDSFITVIPTGDVRTAAQADSIRGVRMAIEQLRGGGALGIMPSGAVSDLSLRDRCVRDRQWQEPAIKLIRKAGVPVVPVRFFDGNSPFYYSLGLISSSVRLLRLPSEVLNKKGKDVRLAIGEPISVESQRSCASLDELRAMLRSSVYDMPLPSSFVRRSELTL